MLNRALRLMRTYHHMTQVELSRRLGISNSYLSELESGVKQPQFDLLERYGQLFKMPVSSILLFSENMEQKPRQSTKLRITAANKVLRLLEWLEVKEEIADDKG